MKYWLIAYVWRRQGSADYYPANDLHKGTLARWFAEMSEHNDEYTLLNAIRITAAEYKALEGKIG